MKDLQIGGTAVVGTWTATLNSAIYTYTAGADDTFASIARGLRDKINSDPDRPYTVTLLGSTLTITRLDGTADLSE